MRVVLILSTCHWRLNEHTREKVTFSNDSEIVSRVLPSFIVMNGQNNDVIRGFRSSLSHFHGIRVFINNESSTRCHQH